MKGTGRASRHWILWAAVLTAIPLPGAETVLAARAADYQAGSRFGRMEFRAELSGTVDLTVEGTSVVAEVYTGSTMKGAAAVYTQPLLRSMPRDFRALSIGAAKVRVLEPPTRANGFKARIRVTSKETKLANVRLLWEADARFEGIRQPVASGEMDNALKGRMEITGRFANDVEFHVRGTEVLADGPFVLQALRFSQPLPARMLTKFGKHGKVEIVAKPDENNQYTATIRVARVKPEGEDRTIVLEWTR